MKQIARNATADDCGAPRDCRYLLHDRDTKFTRSFPGRRCVRWGSAARATATQPEPEYLRRALRRGGEGGVPVEGDPVRRAFVAGALSEYVDHFHAERNHQGKGNVLLFPLVTDRQSDVHCAVPREIGRASALLSS